ncbi:hypothetical protein PEC301937_06230 [Pectobacterium carotovorum subsp. carotovorum]|nr:hypothetical protein PEC301937_06230 [Pectobacterium carotovorum subsp. carotovorum]
MLKNSVENSTEEAMAEGGRRRRRTAHAKIKH